jgi:hypothetical protein
MIQEATQEDAEIIVQEQKELSPRWWLIAEFTSKSQEWWANAESDFVSAKEKLSLEINCRVYVQKSRMMSKGTRGVLTSLSWGILRFSDSQNYRT